MLCQRCNKNNANRYYMGDWNGSLFIVGICSECLEDMTGKAVLSGYGGALRHMAGIYPGKEVPRANGSVPFPRHADPELVMRAHLNDMKLRLEAAVDREDYQEAARLRDAIRNISREESCYES